MPHIPNFTILGRIGGGSYGEVYLARTVTGLFRAVKVVNRGDFDLERTFEREFEGIQRYERVSKGHAGLVDVLHVGREPEADFYFYVMELADDESGDPIEKIDVETYRPRTLASDLRLNPARSIEECIAVGRTIAEALAHLHSAGLIHRDVKPSNIIFVHGEARLADIGLVAHSGQRTFVGTEGYVPPEGPGTSSADLYSLAMVLYEMHTGKDRLAFPELPTNHELSPTINRDEWRALNAVICRAGSPDPRKRFETGLAFSEALRRIRPDEFAPPGSPPPGPKRRLRNMAALGLGVVAFHVVLVAILYLGSGWLLNPPGKKSEHSGTSADSAAENPLARVSPAGTRHSRPTRVPPLPEEEPDPETDWSEAVPGESVEDSTALLDEPPPYPDSPIVAVPVEIPKRLVKLDSFPSGATVFAGEREIGRTPTPFREYEIGEVEFLFRKLGYHDKTVTRVFGVGPPTTVSVELINDFRPMPGLPWTNSSGLQFLPTAGEGDFQARVTGSAYEAFLRSTGRPLAVVEISGVVQLKDDVV